VPPLLDHHLPVRSKMGKGAPLPSTSKAWKKLKVPIKVYLQSVTQLLSQLTDPEAERFVLHYVKALCPYLACFPKLNRAHLKKMLHIWSHSAPDVRVAAFMVIRQTAIVTPHPFIETVLKGVYLTFIRNAKFPTPSTRPTLTFMLNAVVEIYRLDHHAAYQHAFVYIRQLAVHLRNAITVKKKGSFLQVYNWQFMFALRVWAKLLSETVTNVGGGGGGGAATATGAGEGLRPLLYPLVQVALGAIKLIPTARYFPLRFYCLQTLIELMQKTGVYIPLSSYCLEVLESVEMKRRVRSNPGRPLDIGSLLKVSKTQVNSSQYQEAVFQNVFELAVEFYAAIACSISFPESVFLDTKRLRTFLKKNKSRHASDKFRPLLEKLEENAKYINAQRANVGFSPKDTEDIKRWQDQLTAKGQNPFLRYAKVCRASVKARQAMLASTQDIEGQDYEAAKGAKADKKRKVEATDDDSDGDAEDDADEDADDAEETQASPEGKKQRTTAAVALEEDNDDDDAADPEDDVTEFAMSDFEFDSE
jgi:nucleolar complex protein 2